MTKYNIPLPDGKSEQVEADSPEEAKQVFLHQHPEYIAKPAAKSRDPGFAADLAQTLARAWFWGPIQGTAQLAGHLPVIGPALEAAYNATPGSEATTRFFDQQRQRAERHGWQRAAETATAPFNPLFFMAGPEAMLSKRAWELPTPGAPSLPVRPRIGLPQAAKVWARQPATARSLAAGEIGTVTQPVDAKNNADYWKQQEHRAALTALLTGIGGKVAGASEARTAAEETAGKTRAQIARDEAYNKMVTQGKRSSPSDMPGRGGNVGRQNRNRKALAEWQAAETKAWDDYNKEINAAKEKHQGDIDAAWKANQAATDKWHAAQKDAKAKYDAAVKASEKEFKQNQKAALGDAKFMHAMAQEGVPHATNERWLNETLQPIGMGAHGPTAPMSWRTSGQVRNLIGTELNRIRNQEAFHVQQNVDAEGNVTLTVLGDADNRVAGVRSETANDLLNPEDRAAWFDTYDHLVTAPLMRAVQRRNGMLSGRDLADYASAITDHANALMQAGKYREAAGLRSALDEIEDIATAGNPELRTQLDNAKRSYHLWSVWNDAAKAGNMWNPTPTEIAASWERHQGRARYSADTNPENIRLKDWLEGQIEQHKAPFSRGQRFETPPLMPVEKPVETRPPTPMPVEKEARVAPPLAIPKPITMPRRDLRTPPAAPPPTPDAGTKGPGFYDRWVERAIAYEALRNAGVEPPFLYPLAAALPHVLSKATRNRAAQAVSKVPTVVGAGVGQAVNQAEKNKGPDQPKEFEGRRMTVTPADQ